MLQSRRTQMIERIFAGVNGGTFISIDTETVPTLRGGKKNPLQGLVTKRQTGSNVMVFQNKTINAYDAMVRRRLVKEGKDPASFELKPRQWGTRRPNSPFVDHNGEVYLEVIYLKAGEVKFFVGGEERDRDTIEGLVETQAPEQGGLDNKVIIRSFNVNSIKAVTIDRTRIEL